VELIWQENIYPENRGWVVDQLTAVIDGEEAAYLKVENIPLVEYNKWYKSIFDYICRIGGHCLSCSRDTIDIKSHLTLDDLINLHHRYYVKPVYKNFDELFLETEALVKNRYEDQFDTFRKCHVDNPFPAYISVKREYRRKGIALALYQEAAKHYAEKGLALRSSTCITKEAFSVWKKMESMGLVYWVESENCFRFYNGATKNATRSFDNAA